MTPFAVRSIAKLIGLWLPSKMMSCFVEPCGPPGFETRLKSHVNGSSRESRVVASIAAQAARLKACILSASCRSVTNFAKLLPGAAFKRNSGML